MRETNSLVGPFLCGTAMYRVYMGNLDSEVTEETISNLLDQHRLSSTSIVLKRGYAFVDCPDQETFDQTIEQLNGW